MKPGDLVKFRQNFLHPDDFGEVHDFSGCLALLVEPYTGTVSYTHLTLPTN
jgi:hypothetical protein